MRDQPGDCEQLQHKLKILLISHTHWDREWYLPFQEFRWKLVELVDELLDTLNRADRADFPCFMLDGQTILLEDYLELRPSRRDELLRHISAGRILVGPWYVLPDEFLVSGEALIRNLLLGDRLAHNYGRAMAVGYLPDQFGHIAQMPQILHGFGIDAAMLWRGVGEEVRQTEFVWRSPDGSAVLTLHLPTGYSNGQLLPSDPQAFATRIADIRKQLESLTSSDCIVVMNGGDHQFIQRHLPQTILAARQLIHDAEIRHTSLPQAIATIRQSLAERNVALPEITGELRHSKYAHLLPGVLSSRIWIKQRNAQCERALERWAEPLAAWASLVDATDDPAGSSKRYSKRDAKAALELAWRYLLQNQPHDSICGCSIDQVHDEMIARFNWSEGLAQGLAQEAMRHIAESIDTSGWKPGGGNEIAYVVVFNPVSGPRTDFVSFTVVDPPPTDAFTIQDADGTPFPCQVLQRRVNIVNGLPEIDLGFVAHQVPGYGYKTFRLVAHQATGYKQAPVETNKIENEFFIVTVDKTNGTLSLFDKITDRHYDGLNLFVDNGDAGDEYNYDPPVEDTSVIGPAHPPKISLVEIGPCRLTLEIAMSLLLPSELTSDRRARAKRRVDVPARSLITLYPSVPRVDIRTEINNTVKDHRLRVYFPTGIAGDHVFAEGHFHVEQRPVALPQYTSDWVEEPQPTQPQKSFVDVNDGSVGLMVANRGLPEYEAISDTDGITIALTLLRCVGWLSRNDLRSRRGPAGPILAAPGAQCIGMYTFDYSLIPHRAGWAQAMPLAHHFANPMRVQLTGQHPGVLPKKLSFVALHPAELVLTTAKLPEEGDGHILRFYNPTTHVLQAKLSLWQPCGKAEVATLRETPISQVKANGRDIALEIGPHQILTLRMTLR